MLSRDSFAASPNRWADYGASRPDRTSAKCGPPYGSACAFMSVQCFDSRDCVIFCQQHLPIPHSSRLCPRSLLSRTRTSLEKLVPRKWEVWSGHHVTKRHVRKQAASKQSRVYGLALAAPALRHPDMQGEGCRFERCP